MLDRNHEIIIFEDSLTTSLVLPHKLRLNSCSVKTCTTLEDAEKEVQSSDYPIFIREVLGTDTDVENALTELAAFDSIRNSPVLILTRVGDNYENILGSLFPLAMSIDPASDISDILMLVGFLEEQRGKILGTPSDDAGNTSVVELENYRSRIRVGTQSGSSEILFNGRRFKDIRL